MLFVICKCEKVRAVWKVWKEESIALEQPVNLRLLYPQVDAELGELLQVTPKVWFAGPHGA